MEDMQRRYVLLEGERLLQERGRCFSIREGGCRDLFWGEELLCGFFGVERDFLERKAVTEEGIDLAG